MRNHGQTKSLARPTDAAKVARELVGHDLDREIFGILVVDTRNRVTAMHIVSIGSLNGSLVHPRDAFKVAIFDCAAAIILFHNQPCGDPSPSREDTELTQRLREAGRILGIEVLDYLVLGDEGRYFSFKERGLL